MFIHEASLSLTPSKVRAQVASGHRLIGSPWLLRVFFRLKDQQTEDLHKCQKVKAPLSYASIFKL